MSNVSNHLQVLKSAFKDKKKRNQNLILLVVLLVLLLVACNYIFSDKKLINLKTNTKNQNNNNTSNSTSQSENINSNNTTSSNTDNSKLEEKLSLVLSQINGVSDVSIVLSYFQDSKQNVVYNTKEQQKNGETSSEKVVAYNEQSGNKSAIVESVECPKVEGAIVVARGVSSVDIRSKIASAIATVVNIPVYKVQVFEKQ